MPCRPQSNPTFTNSDGVPPELVVLGFRRRPACTGQTGRRYRSDRPAQGFAGVDRFDDCPRILAHSRVLTRFCVNTTPITDQIRLCIESKVTDRTILAGSSRSAAPTQPGSDAPQLPAPSPHGHRGTRIGTTDQAWPPGCPRSMGTSTAASSPSTDARP